MICTFYSYKGGVGRSMALANVAELLYRRGLKVLMVDFDLEAPGLERYFDVSGSKYNHSEILGKRGIIDMLLSYKELRSLPKSNMPQTDKPETQHDFPFSVEPLKNFIVSVYEDSSNDGELYLIPPGRRAGPEFVKYAKRIHSFDWNDFYANWDGELFFEWFRHASEKIADVVLVDSRTGVTEMSGVCTYQLADVVIMFVSPNQQNMDGTLMMAESLSNPKLIEDGRKGRPLSLIFAPSRIEDSEAEKLDRFADEFNLKFEKYIPSQIKLEKNLFIDFKIPYMPYYSY
ncbi:MAG: P-loop NTPase, partial [Bacteroidetes bacterium]|nr:P-loop NTPase [Bacteroidota bacterium]